MIAADRRDMAKLRLVIALAAVTACVRQDTTVDTMFPEPEVVYGPPSGDIDPAWSSTTSDVVTSADTAAIASVTDVEIESTLEGYGEWIWMDEYGWVWRPYATEVGLDFTPYETCGSWVWTEDRGWVYGCDWEWGWLPFHYGQWGWFDEYWAWVPDYEWSPAWVEWRGGGGYVGWRPAGPKVRDHRRRNFTRNRDVATAQGGVVVRDHSRARLRESHWRFATVDDFGKRNIRAHLFKHAAEGLRVTSITSAPPIRGTVRPVSAASVMRDRLQRALANSAPTSYTPAPRPLRRPAPLAVEAPTPVESPSIYEPSDPFRDRPRTRSPIRSDWSSNTGSDAAHAPQSPIRTDAPQAQPSSRGPLPSEATSFEPSPPQPPTPSTTWQPAQQPVRAPLPSDASSWQPPPQPIRTPPRDGSSTPNWQPPVRAPSASSSSTPNWQPSPSSSSSSRWGSGPSSAPSPSSSGSSSRWGSGPSSGSTLRSTGSGTVRSHRGR